MKNVEKLSKINSILKIHAVDGNLLSTTKLLSVLRGVGLVSSIR